MSRLAAALSIVIGLGATTSSRPAHAQTIHSGSRVRIWSSTPSIEGKVTIVSGARDDTLLFRDTPESEELSVAKHSLTRVDLSTSRGSPVLGTLAGVFFGAFVGTGVGSGVADMIAQHDRSTGRCGGDCAFDGFAAVEVGFVAGVISGGIIGNHVAGEKWERVVDPQQIRISLAARPHRGLGVAVTWPTR